MSQYIGYTIVDDGRWSVKGSYTLTEYNTFSEHRYQDHTGEINNWSSFFIEQALAGKIDGVTIISSDISLMDILYGAENEA